MKRTGRKKSRKKKGPGNDTTQADKGRNDLESDKGRTDLESDKGRTDLESDKGRSEGYANAADLIVKTNKEQKTENVKDNFENLKGIFENKSEYITVKTEEHIEKFKDAKEVDQEDHHVHEGIGGEIVDEHKERKRAS